MGLIVRIEGAGQAQQGFYSVNFRAEEPTMFLNGMVTITEAEYRQAVATGGDALNLLVVDKIAKKFTTEEQDNIAIVQLTEMIQEKDKQIKELEEKLVEAGKKSAIKLTEAITTMTMMMAMAGGEEEPLMPPMPGMEPEMEPEPEQDTEPEPETEEQDEEEN